MLVRFLSRKFAVCVCLSLVTLTSCGRQASVIDEPSGETTSAADNDGSDEDDGGDDSTETIASGFPEKWYYYGKDRPDTLRNMEGKSPPPLTVKDWTNGETSLEELRGKVVVVDFWATWCGPCRAAIPKNVAMFEEYSPLGLVIIGVHADDHGVAKMPEVMEELSVQYPSCVDDGSASVDAWNVDFYPSYFVIDRKGKVAAAGLLPSEVKTVVGALLAE